MKESNLSMKENKAFIREQKKKEKLEKKEAKLKVKQEKKEQKLIDTGLYGIVRHPMYSVTLLLFLSMPIVLGSVYAFLIFLAYPFIITNRIKHEEKFLEEKLDGYRAYKQKVKYRLIPFIW